LDSYYLGRVIGAGSFGVVREGIKVATGKRFAVKTVSKVPKRGAPTPRCVDPRLALNGCSNGQMDVDGMSSQVVCVHA
jgi:hypothetical protein